MSSSVAQPSDHSHPSQERPRWFHTIEEPIPPLFMPKSLGGSQAQLAKWICPAFGYRTDRRNFQSLGLDGILWIVKAPRRRNCQVHFRIQDQDKYAEANVKRLAAGNQQQQP